MGIYTILDDEKVDDLIERDLALIIKGILSAATVRSIILGGGFGRGEGSVLINQGKVLAVNDYDLFVVISDGDQTDFRSIGRRIADELGIRLLDLIPIKYSALPNLPSTQFYYDLKYGGRLLWGESVIDLMPQYKEGNVEYESGKLLLLNRLICAIEAYSENFESHGMTTDQRFFLVNQTGKVISSCVEALLIKKGKYNHSYQKRREIFEAEFPEKEELQKLNERATEFKLRPSMIIGFDSIGYWKKAIHEYIKVLSEYLDLGPGQPAEKIWRILRKNNLVTNQPIERVELFLLLCKETSFFSRIGILRMARKELKNISGMSFRSAEWESLRERTACLWHELYH
jgi:hypothetical protein